MARPPLTQLRSDGPAPSVSGLARALLVNKMSPRKPVGLLAQLACLDRNPVRRRARKPAP